jgi:uncharacterized protein YndB with AHSA1/START domain
MKRSEFRPSPLGDATARVDGDHATLVFVRELRHAPDIVWAALTDPAQLQQWAPFDSDRDLGSPGPATLVMAGGEGGEAERSRALVRRAERPRLLEYTWDDDVLRWELSALASGGTRLTLHHTVAHRSWVAKVSAGWHLCIDVLEQALAGQPIGRIVAEEAKQFGWGELEREYAARFGVATTTGT